MCQNKRDARNGRNQGVLVTELTVAPGMPRKERGHPSEPEPKAWWRPQEEVGLGGPEEYFMQVTTSNAALQLYELEMFP